jgi:hypothetical protein
VLRQQAGQRIGARVLAGWSIASRSTPKRRAASLRALSMDATVASTCAAVGSSGIRPVGVV